MKYLRHSTPQRKLVFHGVSKTSRKRIRRRLTKQSKAETMKKDRHHVETKRLAEPLHKAHIAQVDVDCTLSQHTILVGQQEGPS